MCATAGTGTESLIVQAEAGPEVVGAKKLRFGFEVFIQFSSPCATYQL